MDTAAAVAFFLKHVLFAQHYDAQKASNFVIMLDDYSSLANASGTRFEDMVRAIKMDIISQPKVMIKSLKEEQMIIYKMPPLLQDMLPSYVFIKNDEIVGAEYDISYIIRDKDYDLESRQKLATFINEIEERNGTYEWRKPYVVEE